MSDSPTSLKASIQEDMKVAMKARDKRRLGTIRLILAAIKQREVDERTEMDDTAVLGILDKMAKQRRESAEQYRQAGRDDLVAQEVFELEIIQSYLPAALGDEEMDALIQAALAETGAATIKDMGRLMGVLRPKVQGRVDMGAFSARVKAALA